MAKIRRIGVLKGAGFLGMYGVFTGLIIGVVISIVSLLGVSALEDSVPASVGFLFGIGAIIIFPLAYGVIGFITGLIFILIINLCLRIIKGLDLDLEMREGSNEDTPEQKLQQKSLPPPITPTQQMASTQQLQTRVQQSAQPARQVLKTPQPRQRVQQVPKLNQRPV